MNELWQSSGPLRLVVGLPRMQLCDALFPFGMPTSGTLLILQCCMAEESLNVLPSGASREKPDATTYAAGLGDLGQTLARPHLFARNGSRDKYWQPYQTD